jgi:hypothetical protein
VIVWSDGKAQNQDPIPSTTYIGRVDLMTKEISIGRVDLIHMGTTYIFEFQKKREKCCSCNHRNYKCSSRYM